MIEAEMQLYSYEFSPKCRSVIALAKHLGMDLEIIEVNLPKREQKTAEYLRLNPNGKVPVLVDDDFILNEANAILVYLAAVSGSELWPSGNRAQADVLRWLSWQLTELSPFLDKVVMARLVVAMHSGFIGPEPSQGEEALLELSDRVTKTLTILDEHLKDRDFVCGQNLTVADFALVAAISNSEHAGISMARWPGIAAWRVRMHELPSWQATVPPLEVAVHIA